MTDTPPSRFDPFPLVVAWLWPGAGHMLIDQPRRGRLIMVAVLAMFFVGVLVGGVDVVDRRDDWLWFLPQAMCGPLAFMADYMNGTFVRTGRIGAPSIGRVNDIGTLFVALAGLMNLTAMIDAATRPLGTDLDQTAGPGHQRRATDGEPAA